MRLGIYAFGNNADIRAEAPGCDDMIGKAMDKLISKRTRPEAIQDIKISKDAFDGYCEIIRNFKEAVFNFDFIRCYGETESRRPWRVLFYGEGNMIRLSNGSGGCVGYIMPIMK